MSRIALALACLAGVPSQTPDPAVDPAPRLRGLRTWDSWVAEADPEGKSFLAEFKDLLDWMAKNDYTALILRGFVDDRHGGEAAARELARYARSRGVLLLPSVRTDADGFVSHPREHPFAGEAPRRAASAAPRPGEAGFCTSRPENLAWLRRATEWLLDTFEVDGVALETSQEAPRCRCAECGERAPADGLADLCRVAPLVADVFRQKRPQGLVLCAPPGSPWWERPPESLEALRNVPENVLFLWEAGTVPPDGAVPPVRRNAALVGGGGPAHHRRTLRPPGGGGELYRAFRPRLDEIRRSCAAARRLKPEGFFAAVAASPKNPDAELALLAFPEFWRAPELAADEFLRRHVTRLYGEQAAPDVLRLFSAQPALHDKALPFWERYDGRWPAGSAEDARAVARELAAQAALARAAAAKATADGKRRLDALTAILEEYRIVCEAAAAVPASDGSAASKARLAEFYEKAGLPDDLYGYKAWKK
jgi:hypothetical protein